MVYEFEENSIVNKCSQFGKSGEWSNHLWTAVAYLCLRLDVSRGIDNLLIIRLI